MLSKRNQHLLVGILLMLLAIGIYRLSITGKVTELSVPSSVYVRELPYGIISGVSLTPSQPLINAMTVIKINSTNIGKISTTFLTQLLISKSGNIYYNSTCESDFSPDQERECNFAYVPNTTGNFSVYTELWNKTGNLLLDTNIFYMNVIEPTTPPSGGSAGGSTGGAGGVVTTTTTPSSQEPTQMLVRKFEEAKVSFKPVVNSFGSNLTKEAMIGEIEIENKDELKIEKIVIATLSEVESAKIIVKDVIPTSDIPPPIPQTSLQTGGSLTQESVAVYKYLAIEKSILPESSIAHVNISFIVEKKWIIDNEIQPSTIALSRFSDNKWERLSSTRVKEDENNLYFVASSPGLSLFSVIGEKTNKSALKKIGEALLVPRFPEIIEVPIGEYKTFAFIVSNNGKIDVHDITINVISPPYSTVGIDPKMIFLLKPGKEKIFLLGFKSSEMDQPSITPIQILVRANETYSLFNTTIRLREAQRLQTSADFSLYILIPAGLLVIVLSIYLYYKEKVIVRKVAELK